MEERLTTDQAVAGSSPATDALFYNPLLYFAVVEMQMGGTKDLSYRATRALHCQQQQFPLPLRGVAVGEHAFS